MFERNKIDNAPATTAVPVTISFPDGTEEKGKLFAPIGRSLQDYLNSPHAFIEFEPYGGERSYITKTQIQWIKLIGVPKSAALSTQSVQKDDFDPHAVLGVNASAEWPAIRSAYVERAKTYHPDRYSTADLPAEVRDYLAANARRVNLAYEILEATQQVRKEAAAVCTAPIYQTSARA